jgi:hypothetical protein
MIMVENPFYSIFKSVSVLLGKFKRAVNLRMVEEKQANGQTRYDLEGKYHGGVNTPHKQKYKNNVVNGVVKSSTRASKKAELMDQQDVRTVIRYLERSP